MRRMTRWGAVIGLAAAVLVAGTRSGIAQDKLAEIKARQDFMKRQQDDVDAINAYAKGKGDKAVALEKANDLLSLTGKIVDQFPAGTSATDFPGKTKAKPEIWQEMDKFKAIPPRLHTMEVKLVDVINTGTPQQAGDEMRSIYRGGCNSCHGPYRMTGH